MAEQATTSNFKNFVPYTPKKGEEYMNDAQKEHFRQILVSWKSELMEDQVLDVDLERALEGLSAAHRTVVVARFFMDWSVEETADVLGIRPGTVKSRLSRALDQLAEELSGIPVFRSVTTREDAHHES